MRVAKMQRIILGLFTTDGGEGSVKPALLIPSQSLPRPSSPQNDCLRPTGFISIEHLRRVLILCWFHHFSHHQAPSSERPSVTEY